LGNGAAGPAPAPLHNLFLITHLENCGKGKYRKTTLVFLYVFRKGLDNLFGLTELNNRFVNHMDAMHAGICTIHAVPYRLIRLATTTATSVEMCSSAMAFLL
jgi:hypothetical protein